MTTKEKILYLISREIDHNFFLLNVAKNQKQRDFINAKNAALAKLRYEIMQNKHAKIAA